MSPWKRDTPARITERLVVEHEHQRIGRQLRDNLRLFSSDSPEDVRSVTGQDPITEDEDD